MTRTCVVTLPVVTLRAKEENIINQQQGALKALRTKVAQVQRPYSESRLNPRWISIASVSMVFGGMWILYVAAMGGDCLDQLMHQLHQNVTDFKPTFNLEDRYREWMRAHNLTVNPQVDETLRDWTKTPFGPSVSETEFCNRTARVYSRLIWVGAVLMVLLAEFSEFYWIQRHLAQQAGWSTMAARRHRALMPLASMMLCVQRCFDPQRYLWIHTNAARIFALSFLSWEACRLMQEANIERANKSVLKQALLSDDVEDQPCKGWCREPIVPPRITLDLNRKYRFPCSHVRVSLFEILWATRVFGFCASILLTFYMCMLDDFSYWVSIPGIEKIPATWGGVVLLICGFYPAQIAFPEALYSCVTVEQLTGLGRFWLRKPCLLVLKVWNCTPVGAGFVFSATYALLRVPALSRNYHVEDPNSWNPADWPSIVIHIVW